jgi:hypothetical protein
MRARKLKVWSWNDYRYPMALAAVLVALTALIGVVGLFQSNDQRGSQIIALNSDSQCRSGSRRRSMSPSSTPSTGSSEHPSTGLPDEAAARQHSSSTSRPPAPNGPHADDVQREHDRPLPPATTIPPPEKASTTP